MDATYLVSAWNNIILKISYIFTEPSARTWQQIVTGWVLRRGPMTVTGILRTLGNLADRHWTVYQKFFYRAAWSLKDLSIALLVHVIYPMIIESGVLDQATGKPVADMAIDETTAGRCGKHVAHAGWFKDASTSACSHKGTVIHWAHNWIVGALTVRLPQWSMIRWVLPAVFALYRKRSDCQTEEVFLSHQELAGELIQTVAQALAEVQLRVSADGQYAKRPVVQKLPEGVNLVSRIRRDAAIYQLPAKRTDKGYYIYPFAPECKNKKMQSFLFVARKGQVKEYHPAHDGEEFLHVLEGSIKFQVGHMKYSLKEGDILYFDSLHKHQVIPVSQEAKYLVVHVFF